MNSTDPEPFSQSSRIIASVIYCFLSLLGLVPYLFVCYVLHKEREIFSQTFYKVIFHIAYSDVAYLILCILFAAPLTLTNSKLFGDFLSDLIANLDSILYNSGAMLALVLSLNRFFAIMGTLTQLDSSFLGLLFCEYPRMLFPLIFSWLYACGWAIILHVNNCPKVFFTDRMHFGYKCDDYGTFWFQAYVWFVSFLPFGTFGVYVVIFLSVKRLRRVMVSKPKGTNPNATKASQQAQQAEQEERAKRERMMVYQGLMVAMAHCFNNVAFFVFSGFQTAAGPILTTSATILNCSINSVIYFVFNGHLREHIKEYYT